MASFQRFFIFVLVLLQSAADASTYLAEVEAGGRLVSVAIGTKPQLQLLHLDLDASLTWVRCDRDFFPARSSTFRPCSSGCSEVPLSKKTMVPVSMDTVILRSTNGDDRSNTSRVEVTEVKFGCRRQTRSNRGTLALGRNSLSFPSQISVQQKGIPAKFTLCLSQDSRSSIFFGDSSFIFGGINLDPSTQRVPFVSNPVRPSSYYLPITSLGLDGQSLGLSSSIFNIDTKTGTGGLKFSSKEKYTKLAGPAYLALRDAFKNWASRSGLALAKSRPPLELCFNSSSLNFNRLGPVVPTIDLVMGKVTWTLTGISVVELKDDSACLAFMDAGPLPATSSIGLFQQYNNLLHFDIAGSSFSFIDRGLQLYRLRCKAFEQ